MSSQAKIPSPTDINLTAVVDGETIDAGDVTTAFNDVKTEIDNARTQVSVSASDTHIKNLDDAIAIVAPIVKEIVNPSGDEQLRIKLSDALIALAAELETDGDVPYTSISTTGLTPGQPLVADGSGGINSIPAPTGTSPVDVEGTAGETLAERDIVFLDTDGEWYKIDIDAVPIKCSSWRGVVYESGGISSAATGTIRIIGEVAGFSGLTPWLPVFASTTPGGYTQTKPTVTAGGGQKAVVPIGIATGTTSILVNTPANKVEYVSRSSLANGNSITVQHHSDPLARNRDVSAYQSGTDAGAAIEEYSATNYDSNVQLRGQSGAGGTTTIAASGSSAAIGNSGGNNFDLAQSFQVAAGQLTQFTFTLLANTGSPVGTLTWQICSDSGGVPGSVIATGALTPTPSAVNTVNITNGPFLQASTSYWLVLKSTTTQSVGVFWSWTASSSSVYAGGEARYQQNGGGFLFVGSFSDAASSFTTSAVLVNDKLSQSFRISSSGNIKSASAYLKKTGSPTGTLTLRIESDSGGSPSGSLVDANATSTVAESALSTAYGLIQFTFPADIPLSASTDYWLVLSTTRAASQLNFVEWGADGSSPSYANGEMKRERSSTWSAESKDAVFRVSAPDTVYQGPIAVDFWTFTTTAIVCRFDDGSGANGDTNTTFKNRSGSTLDVSVIVEMA